VKVKCGLLNALSICNKLDDIVEHITINTLGILFIVDTWLTGNLSDYARRF
jgi:hypothetical protein